jgi:hypothetical protein
MRSIVRQAIIRTMAVIFVGACALSEEQDPDDNKPTDQESAMSQLDLACTPPGLEVGPTTQTSNRYIDGYGSMSCNGKATITLQWRRWWGWVPLASVPVSYGQGDVHVRWDCYHTGIHDYMTTIWKYDGNNDYQHKDSNVIRVNCF